MNPGQIFSRSFRASVVACVVGLSGCASAVPAPRGPELPHFDENAALTFRLDVLEKGERAGHGTATVISTEGHMLTAYHVVSHADTTLQIVMDVRGLPMPVAYPAKVIAFDKSDDLAVIKVERTFAQPAVFENMQSVHAGDGVYHVGYPYSFGKMVGRGSISKLHYTVKDKGRIALEDALVLDTPDGPGTSGTAIFATSNGRIVGVMRLMIAISDRGTPPMVVRIATPGDHVTRFLDKNRIPYTRAPEGA